MVNKNKFKNELTTLKIELERLKKKEGEINTLLTEKVLSEKMSSNLLSLFKVMMDENKATRQLIQQTYEKITQIGDNFAVPEEQGEPIKEKLEIIKTVPISDLDKKILQYIQIVGMASAADIQKVMNYKGKNAATARLTKLYKQGLLDRYQLGHKVFYKFDAGKATTNSLIISPP
ncbi:MAG: hypothetical protein M1538_02590 [Candidatus Marsarchaeota archaeon]|jgi:hypothetical protein|nr:hypothetical protein [Candidatus Marsarchaeota archaeon]